MPKSIFLLLFCVLPLIGVSQSARKVNERLKLDYTAKLKTYDSIYNEHTILFATWQKKCDEIETAAKPLGKRLQEVGGMARNWSQLSHDLGLLEIPHPPDSMLENQGKAVDLITDSISRNLRSILNGPKLEAKTDFSVGFPQKGSVKQDNQWLTDVIPSIDAKNTSLQTVNMEFGRANATLDWSLQAMAYVQKTIDSMETVFQKDIITYTYQKEQARNNYVKNGPKGFNESYGKVFPDAFLPKVFADEVYSDGLKGEFYEVPPPPAVEEAIIHSFVEESAEFPGGMTALKAYIEANLKIPEVAIQQGLEGRCYLQFIVSKSGNVSNVEVKRGVPDCPECDAEAIRMVKSMPKWKPGKNGGKPVNSTFNLPVSFKLPK
jgi:protein TonB